VSGPHIAAICTHLQPTIVDLLREPTFGDSSHLEESSMNRDPQPSARSWIVRELDRTIQFADNRSPAIP
jgi:hypothetical protein